MKYPFNKPPVICRPLGTAADILLHSYTQLPSYLIRGTGCWGECKEDVRGRERGSALLSLFPYSYALYFFVCRLPLTALRA